MQKLSNWLRWSLGSLLIFSNPAIAGEVPLYQPSPDWVILPDLQAVLSDESVANESLVSFDRQIKLEDGEAWSYADVILRANSNEMLAQIGRLHGRWQPELGDFIIHEIQIIRNGEQIDILSSNSKRFEVLRRESGLEQFQVNGILTAYLEIEGLRLGDMVRFRASTTSSQPAYDGNLQLIEALLAEPAKLQYGQLRVIWPESTDAKYTISGEDIEQTVEIKDGYKNLKITLPVAEQPETPPKSPKRYTIPAMVEVSSFEDWRAVSRSAWKPYQTEGLIIADSDLELEVRKIAEDSDDPIIRAAAALRLVQDQVRYLYNGFAGGDYTPQTPQETWALRFGDCKAKALLLLSILHRLGIEAQPALVNSVQADAVAERLPSLGLFDHILVRANIDGRIYWLDGTKSGDRIADIGDTPVFQYALPLQAEGANLEKIAIQPMTRPMESALLSIDSSAGIYFPAPYKLEIVARGQIADQLNAMKSTLSSDQYDEMVGAFVSKYAGQRASVIDQEASFDKAAGTVTFKGNGLMTMSWRRDADRPAYKIDNYLDNSDILKPRTKPEWRDIPYALTYPGYFQRTTKIKLPNGEDQFELKGAADVNTTVMGYEQSRQSKIEDDLLSVNEFWRTAGWELSAEQVNADRAEFVQLQKTPLQVVASKAYPPSWLETKQAIETEKLGAIIATYRRDIELNPEDARPYENLVGFYQATFQFEKAAKVARELIEQEKTAKNYMRAAWLMDSAGDDGALEMAEKALELDPSSTAAISLIAEILSSTDTSEKALAFLSTVENNGVDPDMIAGTKAEILLKFGGYEEALVINDELLSDKPNDPERLNNRCWVKGRANLQLESALKDCTKAIQLGSSPSAALDSRALVFFRLGQFEDALSDLNMALDISPNLAPALYLRGLTYAKLDRIAESETDIAAAKFIYPRVADQYIRFGLTL